MWKSMQKHAILIRYARHWHVSRKRTMATQGAHSPGFVSRAFLPGKHPVSKVLVVLLIQSDLKYSDDLFNYTRARFICDEEYEMSQRQVVFNVNELARCAADAVGALSCVSIEKYPDGMYNKSMLLTMGNGRQVVAKIPNPNAGRPHFTIASEVPTMDFVRLGVVMSRYFS
jgi:hypothetical protein